MIDEKKIEEAAKDYINKNDYFVKYDEDPCDDIEFAYKDGAHWAINEFLKDLWHPAKEEPNEKAYLLCCRKNKVLPFKVDKHSAIYDWKVNVYNFNITRWLYIEDLLPKKGGEE